MRHLSQSLAAIAVLSVPALAQFTIVTPPGYAATPGNSNNSFPWGRATASMRHQQIYDSTNFTTQGANYPIIISRLRFRSYAVAATWAGGSWPSIQINMATSPLDFVAASATFASNLGPDLTNVVNGPVTVTGGSSSVGVPGPWCLDIPLTTNFLYDPSSGNDLTLDVILNGAGWTGASTFFDAVTTATTIPPPLSTRIYDTVSATGLTGTVGTHYGLITEFTYVPASGLYAGFTATPRAGASPLMVQFTDQTYTSGPGGVTSWSWDLDGDTVVDSTVQNPMFTYTGCSSYNVSLTVTDATHSPSTLTRNGYIVTDVVTPNFTFSTLPGNVVQFTDTSTPTPTSWSWDLNGDNVPDSTLQNPVFVYPGSCTTTTVSLTVNRLCRGPYTTSRSLVLSPNTFTTLLTAGNGLSGVGSGNTFDIQVTNPGGVVICAVSLCPYMATPVLNAPLGCTIWVTDAPGGFASNHTNAAVWRQVATGTGVFGGGTFTAPVPVPMSLSNSIYLPAGTFGMAVHMTTGAGVAYTTNTANVTYPGPDFNVIAGNGKATPFAAAANANRGWNGRIHYSTSANNEAGYGYFGTGCAGTLGIPGNTASSLPKLGQTMTANLSRLNMNAAFFILGFSRTSSVFGPLPFNLTPLGAPGCFGRVSTDSVLLIVGAGNTASYNLAVPNNAIYLGNLLYTQGLSIDTPINVLGGVTTDAAAFIVGQ